jgi:hypothetical protein
MNGLKRDKFVVVLVDARDEVERGVTSVNDFVVLPLNKVAELWWSTQYQVINLSCHPQLFYLFLTKTGQKDIRANQIESNH